MKIKHQQKNTKNNSRGFTIVETLVAIFILLITTTGPLSFAQSSLKSSFQARDQITAFYLAQDAIETIKNIRDANQLNIEVDWLENLGSCRPSVPNIPVMCNIYNERSNVESETCTGISCPKLKYDSTTKQFVLSSMSGDTSKYTRTIYVTQIETNEIQVVVEVKFDGVFLSSPKRIIVQENLYKKY
jgi:Tfp pilus assembly protein PilV